MGGTPQLPRNMGDASGFINWCKWVEGKISFILEKLNNPFANTGMSVPGPGVVECDGQFNVVGNETVSGTLNVTGNTVIGGTLSLPNGIINNAALTSPVSPLSAHVDGTNFSLATGANVAKVTLTITVPSGYSQALVYAGSTMNAKNTTATADYAYLGVKVGGASIGWSPMAYAPPGVYCTAAANGTGLLTSLGSTFTIQATASTGAAGWSADPNNIINLDAIVVFLR